MQKTLTRKPDESYDDLLRDDLLFYIPEDSYVLDLRITPIPESGQYSAIVVPECVSLALIRPLCAPGATVCLSASGRLTGALRDIRSQGIGGAITPYRVYPNFEVPRFIIPLDDTALRFSLHVLTIGTGLRGTLVRALLRLPLSLMLTRLLMNRYVLYFTV